MREHLRKTMLRDEEGHACCEGASCASTEDLNDVKWYHRYRGNEASL
jgi:hypothetical protein